MLTQAELNVALIDAQKSANACGVFCRVSGSTEGDVYFVSHNGTGSGDTDQQRVYLPAVVGLGVEQLAARLSLWLTATHRRTKFDLNEG